jgi:ABC-type lipoprotein release transport system permease subunit
MILFLAYRNLSRRLKRYSLMALAIAIAFALITMITGATYGSLEAVKDKAARYFSGHIDVMGYNPTGRQDIPDPQGVFQTLISSSLPLRTVAPRTVYYNNDAVLFYAGQSVRQRRLIGVDFSREGKEFSSLSFIQGSWEPLSTASDQSKGGILISLGASKLLGCRVGDQLTLYLTTDTGQYNTADLIVRGIFNETSLFGYAAYMNNRELNRLLERPENSATDMAVYVRSGFSPDAVAVKMEGLLARSFSVAPLFNSREKRDAVLGTLVKEPTLIIMTQNAQLAQIRQFLDALLGVTYFVLTVFLVIILTGILNTYRVLVHERTKEIGVLRALGMQRGTVRFLFILEAALLGLFSALIGFLLGFVLLKTLGSLDLSFIPGSGLILENGHLRTELNSRTTLLNGLLMIGTTILAAWGPARRAGQIRPVDAMRSN